MGKVIYVRHGESVRNVQGVFVGRKDNTPLTDKGRAQALKEFYDASGYSNAEPVILVLSWLSNA